MLDPELMNKYGGCRSHFPDPWMFKASLSILDLVFLLLLPFNGRIGIKMIICSYNGNTRMVYKMLIPG